MWCTRFFAIGRWEWGLGAGSRILEVHGQRMAEGNFVPGGRCTTQRKDMAQVRRPSPSLGPYGPSSVHSTMKQV